MPLIPYGKCGPDPKPSRETWLERWSMARAKKKHDRWEAEFRKEFSVKDSMVHKTVIALSMGVSHGMIMGIFDARGIIRCAFCISTDQLRKRIIQRGVAMSNGKSTDKAIYCCPVHWETPIPEKRAVDSPEKSTDGRSKG